MVRQAFTVVEILITIAIMGILLTLVIVNVNSTQANARDTERKADVEAIATLFESYYETTNDSSGGQFWMSGLSYPDTIFVSSEEELKKATPDLDPKALRAPGVNTSDPMNLIPATNTTQTTAGVLPQPTTSTYVYQPLSSSNTLCVDSFTAGGCRKFNLYYRLETDGQVYQLTSKHQ
jgi:prepilin-type N-terminal cleavage/methylation domain-containing protein